MKAVIDMICRRIDNPSVKIANRDLSMFLHVFLKWIQVAPPDLIDPACPDHPLDAFTRRRILNGRFKGFLQSVKSAAEKASSSGMVMSM
jgi:hypothetical protein